MIGGKILDASALERRRAATFAWLRTARVLGIVLYLPAFALAEVRAVAAVGVGMQEFGPVDPHVIPYPRESPARQRRGPWSDVKVSEGGPPRGMIRPGVPLSRCRSSGTHGCLRAGRPRRGR